MTESSDLYWADCWNCFRTGKWLAGMFMVLTGVTVLPIFWMFGDRK